MRYAGLGLLLLALTSCQMTGATTGTATDAVRVVCQGFGPITYSSSGDEPETVAQIRAHNAAWLELCDPQP